MEANCKIPSVNKSCSLLDVESRKPSGLKNPNLMQNSFGSDFLANNYRATEATTVKDASSFPEIADNVEVESAICAQRFDEKKNTLILDVEGTLLCTSMEKVSKLYREARINIGDKQYIAYFILRPGAEEFLEDCSKHYNICLCTTAEINFTKALAAASGITRFIFKIIARPSLDSSNSECGFAKDVAKLGFNPSRTILIDDSYKHVSSQPDNAVRIKAFEGDSRDREIYFMGSFCKSMAQSKEVRPVVANMFQYFQSGKFNLKQFDLLSTNQKMFDQLSTDDIDEQPASAIKVKSLERPIEEVKFRIKMSMDNLSILGVVDENCSRIIGEGRLSMVNTHNDLDEALPSNTNLSNSNLLAHVLKKRDSIFSKK